MAIKNTKPRHWLLTIASASALGPGCTSDHGEDDGAGESEVVDAGTVVQGADAGPIFNAPGLVAHWPDGSVNDGSHADSGPTIQQLDAGTMAIPDASADGSCEAEDASYLAPGIITAPSPDSGCDRDG